MNYKGCRFSDKLFLCYIRDLPGHPFKLRIVNWVNTLIFNDAVQLRNSNGSLIQVSTKEFIGHQIVFSGSYESQSLELAEKILQDGGAFVDIGANSGLFTTYLAVLKNVEVYAIEPSASNFLKLQSNILLNGFENVRTANVGLSDKTTFGYLDNPTPLNSGTFKTEENNHTNSYLIGLYTLSDLILHFNIQQIKLLKIDVEGFEMKIFKGYFGKGVPLPENIIMEFSDMMERTGYTMEDCYDFFRDLGYQSYTIHNEIYHVGDHLPDMNVWFKKELGK